MKVCPLVDSALSIPEFKSSLCHIASTNTQRSSAKSSIILKSSNCVTITLDILDMGEDSQTARTQHSFFITFPLPA